MRKPPTFGALRHIPDEPQADAMRRRAWRERGWFDAQNAKPKRKRDDVMRFGGQEAWNLYQAGWTAGSSTASDGSGRRARRF